MIPASNGPPTIGSLSFVEEMWARYRAQPESVSPDWQQFFERWSFDAGNGGDGPSFHVPGFFESELPSGDGQVPAPATTRPAAAVDNKQASQGNGTPAAATLSEPHPEHRRRGGSRKQHAVTRLIEAYRDWGHLAARLDPLDRPRPEVPQLHLASFGLDESDLDTPFFAGELAGPPRRPLRDIIAALQAAYCGTVGVQYTHIEDPAVRAWLGRRFEDPRTSRPLNRSLQLRILNRLTAASVFEEFVRKRYVGAKTFSLAGAESMIPLLDIMIERAATLGVFEIVLGMAHRGRLNVLAHILGKRAQEIFRELDEQETDLRPTSGDVRYHLGYSTDWLSHRGDRIHLSLSFNPSHLEYVNPVALGRLRAKQLRAGDHERRRGMTILIHGDASFAGEGIVQETLNLARLPGYTTGGTIHVIVNNQLGFTTDPSEGRSTTYASDVALGFGVPVFHVNGDDVDAVARVARLAMAFRHRFQRDVVIDLYGFRRWGHNEVDEPSFTQPLMYRRIEQQPSVREKYLQKLIEASRVSPVSARRMEKEYAARLQRELEAASHTRSAPRPASLGGVWAGYIGGREPPDDVPATYVPVDKLQQLLTKLIEVPEGFQPHRKLVQGLERRAEMARGERPLDWSTAEALAMASLAVEGRPIRLTGQDTARGTFSQRHAVWHDEQTGRTYMPLAHLSPNQAPVEVINSPLCEAGTMGFEYGFSLDYPEALVAWEAQFGDFWNAAQVIFDQFLGSAEDKWSRLSGLVLLLPHGFEGQGPEHSSGRLERFLASTAEHNIQVVVPSTPAQFFHCLRRQVLRRWQKPLIVLTPKSLLRHHRVVSSLEELATGSFQRVLPDPLDVAPHADASSRNVQQLLDTQANNAAHAAPPRSPQDVRRVLLCMGKMYYDLEKARDEQQRSDVALVRIEQFYPFPAAELAKILSLYPDNVPIWWVQEEPANMGAWQYLQVNWPRYMSGRPQLVGVTRRESASPATGSHAAHKHEQQHLIARAFRERT